MVPGGIALSRGKGLAGAARAIAAEAIDDAATSRASQAANVVTGGYLGWIPAPIASILFGGKPKPRVSGVVDDAAEAAKDAGTVATKSADDVAEAAGRGAATAAPQSTVRVYRVEGVPNSHVTIGEGGVVAIKQGNKTIFFNFGSRARAEQYLSQKLDPMQKLGPVPGATVRSFEVPESFLDAIRSGSVPEHLAKKYPNAPIRVDITKAPDQFGLRPEQVESMRRTIIQGTGQEGL